MNRKPDERTPQLVRLLDVRSAAALLGVSPWTVYHWARVGLVGSVTLGRRRLFELETLEDFIQRGRRARLVPCTEKGDEALTGRSRSAGNQ